MKKNNSYWPVKANNLTNSPFVSVHQKLGFQPWFSENRDEYDDGAYQNSCFNLLPNFMCGKANNKFINKEK